MRAVYVTFAADVDKGRLVVTLVWFQKLLLLTAIQISAILFTTTTSVPLPLKPSGLLYPL